MGLLRHLPYTDKDLYYDNLVGLSKGGLKEHVWAVPKVVFYHRETGLEEEVTHKLGMTNTEYGLNWSDLNSETFYRTEKSTRGPPDSRPQTTIYFII